MTNADNHETRQPFNRDEIERNRPGSPYVELDLEEKDAAQKIGTYYIDLQKRHKYWYEYKAPFRAPEQFPGPTDVELILLENLVSQDGKVNFWDTSIEIAREDGSLTTSWDQGCRSFVDGLGLEVEVQQ